jgi:hypothetical protein
LGTMTETIGTTSQLWEGWKQTKLTKYCVGGRRGIFLGASMIFSYQTWEWKISAFPGEKLEKMEDIGCVSLFLHQYHVGIWDLASHIVLEVVRLPSNVEMLEYWNLATTGCDPSGSTLGRIDSPWTCPSSFVKIHPMGKDAYEYIYIYMYMDTSFLYPRNIW